MQEFGLFKLLDSLQGIFSQFIKKQLEIMRQNLIIKMGQNGLDLDLTTDGPARAGPEFRSGPGRGSIAPGRSDEGACYSDNQLACQGMNAT